MKKNFTLLILFMSIQFSFAQITVINDNFFTLGLTVFQAADNMPDASILPGMTGNTNWDFSALQQTGIDTFKFVSPAGTPFEDDFPTANLAFLQGEDLIYVRENVNEILILGTGVEGAFGIDTLSFVIKNELPITLERFPIEYGKNYDDESRLVLEFSGADFGVTFADSVRTTSHSFNSREVDAFGTMTTPSGDFEALRIRKQEVTFDTIELKAFGNWTTFDAAAIGDTSITYTWWTNETGFGFPFVEMSFDTDSLTGQSYIDEVNWTVRSTVGVNPPNLVQSADVFPIPAADFINFQFDEKIEGRVDVIDFNGRKLISKKVDSLSVKLNLNIAPTGTYIAVFTKNDGRTIGFKKFTVAK